MKKIISIVSISILSLIVLTGCAIQNENNDTSKVQQSSEKDLNLNAENDSEAINDKITNNKEDILEEIVIKFKSGEISYNEVLAELEKQEITEKEFDEYSKIWSEANGKEESLEIIYNNFENYKENILKEIVKKFKSGEMSYSEVLAELGRQGITEKEFEEYSKTWNEANDK